MAKNAELPEGVKDWGEIFGPLADRLEALSAEVDARTQEVDEFRMEMDGAFGRLFAELSRLRASSGLSQEEGK